MIAARLRTFFFLTLLLGRAIFPLPAAEDSGEGNDDESVGGLPADPDWPDVIPDLYSRGDKVFGISLGPLVSLFFIGDSGVLDNNVGPVGGTLSLSYTFFLNSHVFLGGELQGMFTPTVAENMLFMVPMGLRIGYQFVLGRFEIPLSLMAGFAPQIYLEKDYGGLFIKPAASLFWRFNPDWSFGLNAAWWWVPEWTARTVYGNFLELTLSARYHF
jgi:hypothetical protein